MSNPLRHPAITRGLRTAKEMTRHVLHSIGLSRSLAHLDGSRADRFAKIYRNGVWRMGNADAPGSGMGSTLEVTKTFRRELPALVRALEVGTLLDIGCGDFTWMQSVELDCDYVGLDIVPSVVNENTDKFAKRSRIFLIKDAVAGLEGLRADLVLCREVLFHLSFVDAKALLKNAIGTDCRYLLLTSDNGTAFNSDIKTGDFRMLNLMKPPFSFPPPAKRIDDAGLTAGRYIGLWPVSDIMSATA